MERDREIDSLVPLLPVAVVVVVVRGSVTGGGLMGLLLWEVVSGCFARSRMSGVWEA
jgi:hypothetical protein